MKKVFCSRDHRMVEIISGLMLCECSTYGRLSYLKGIEDDARALADRSGGLQVLRDKIEQAEQEELDRKRALRQKSR